MSILGAIGSIAGGLLGKSKTIDPRESVTLHTRGIKQAAEWYGFNPLTLLQNVSPSSTVTGPNPMGSAIADAAMFAADAFLQKGNQQALLVNEYQRQNKELQDRLTHVTLQPKVPGVYGGGDGRPDQGVSVGDPGGGGAGGGGPAGAPAGLDPIQTVEGIDPRRDVDVKPVPNSSGFMLVDNPWLGKYWFPTIDGDEPVDLLDMPSLGPFGAQAAYQHGNKMTFGGGAESRPRWTAESWREELARRNKAKPKRPKKRPAYFDLPDPNSAFSPRMKFPWE